MSSTRGPPGDRDWDAGQLREFIEALHNVIMSGDDKSFTSTNVKLRIFFRFDPHLTLT